MNLLIHVVRMKNIEEETNFLFKTKLLVRVTFSKWRKIVSVFKQGNFDLDVVYTFLMLNTEGKNIYFGECMQISFLNSREAI